MTLTDIIDTIDIELAEDLAIDPITDDEIDALLDSWTRADTDAREGR